MGPLLGLNYFNGYIILCYKVQLKIEAWFPAQFLRQSISAIGYVIHGCHNMCHIPCTYHSRICICLLLWLTVNSWQKQNMNCGLAKSEAYVAIYHTFDELALLKRVGTSPVKYRYVEPNRIGQGRTKLSYEMCRLSCNLSE